MIRSLQVIFLLSSTLLSATSSGQGLVHKLPEDGTWSKYRVTQQLHRISVLRKPSSLTKEQVARFPQIGFSESELSISSVGRETVGGEPCRWIELCTTTGKREILLRLLVAESSLGSAGDAFSDAKTVLFQDTASIGGKHGEITGKRRVYELERFRPIFPPIPDNAQRLKGSV